jgi:hypothetical protein
MAILPQYAVLFRQRAPVARRLGGQRQFRGWMGKYRIRTQKPNRLLTAASERARAVRF